jgi:pimeloyl-ACP methyl ester carboxylesterase
MPHLPVNGIDLFYERTGSGPPLVLIAGLASDSASWAPVVAPLSERFSLFMPDNRGVGRTRPSDAPVSVAAIAADIGELIVALDLAPAHLLGHSLGGAIACRLAADRPDLVSRVVAAAAGLRVPGRVQALLEDLIRLRRRDDDETLFYRLFFQWLFRDAFFDDAERVEDAVRLAATYPFRATADGLEAQVRAALAFDGRDRIGAVKAPLLVLSAGEDRLFGEADFAPFVAAPNVAFASLAGAGHSLHWDDPVGFADAVADFLGR